MLLSRSTIRELVTNMNIRQKKKLHKLSKHDKLRLTKAAEAKFVQHHCAECSHYWNRNQNKYFAKWGCCDQDCYAKLVGMDNTDWYPF